MRFKSVLTMTVIAGAMLSSCGKKQQGAAPSANFETMKVATKTLTLDNKYSATIRGRQDIEVYPQVSGTLQKLCVTEGQKVTAGQTMFIIDQVPYKAALNTAEAALQAAQAAQATAQLNYDSRKQLFDQQVVSEFDMQTAHNSLLTAKAQVAQCEAQVVNARNNLSYTVVKSPANGVVGTLPYRQGALVGPSMPQSLTTVSDNNQMYVYFSMNETELLNMTRNNGSLDSALAAIPQVKLLLVDGSEYNLPGKVESISGVVDRNTGSVQVRAVFDNPDKLLHSGSTGQILLPVTYNDIIVIPATAAVQTQDQFNVFTVDNENIAHTRLIKISNQNAGSEFIVTEGVQVGETIVAKGAGMIHDEQNIKPNAE